MAHHMYGFHEEAAKKTGFEDPYDKDKILCRCPLCPTNTIKNNLKQHLRLSHNITIPKSMKIFKVAYSYARTYSKKLFKQFFPDIEEGAKTEVKCPVCSKTVMSNRFTRHYQTNHRSKCTLCDIAFPTYHQKSKHMAIVHNVTTHFDRFKIKKKECYICGQKYLTPSEVRDHIRTEHEKLRSFLCDICGDAFFRKSALTSHRIRHFNLRLYQCKLCSNGYSDRTALKKHLKSRHNVIIQGKWNDPLADRESLPWRKLSESEAKELRDSNPNGKTNILKIRKKCKVKENESIAEPDFLLGIL